MSLWIYLVRVELQLVSTCALNLMLRYVAPCAVVDLQIISLLGVSVEHTNNKKTVNFAKWMMEALKERKCTFFRTL